MRMGKKCRIWWPTQLSSSKSTFSSSAVLFGWFISSSSASLDVVVAFASDEVSLSQLQPGLQVQTLFSLVELLCVPRQRRIVDSDLMSFAVTVFENVGLVVCLKSWSVVCLPIGKGRIWSTMYFVFFAFQNGAFSFWPQSSIVSYNPLLCHLVD